MHLFGTFTKGKLFKITENQINKNLSRNMTRLGSAPYSWAGGIYFWERLGHFFKVKGRSLQSAWQVCQSLSQQCTVRRLKASARDRTTFFFGPNETRDGNGSELIKKYLVETCQGSKHYLGHIHVKDWIKFIRGIRNKEKNKYQKKKKNQQMRHKLYKCQKYVFFKLWK